jgi:hypothetical protein
MKKKEITVLFGLQRISLMYSLYPIWLSKHIDRFVFTNDWDWVLKKDKNPYIFLVRCFAEIPSSDQRMELLMKLRKKYAKVILFDDNDGTESYFLEMLPILDKYYKKQVFSNLRNYGKAFYGKRIFSDYYQQLNSGAYTESFIANVPDPDKLGEISLLWNLGIGQYPLSKLRNFIGKKSFPYVGKTLMPWLLSKKEPNHKIPKPGLKKCHARFGYGHINDPVAAHRKLFLETLKGQEPFLVGQVDRKTYQREISQVQAVFSPYGWGEICFRDFEAIINGAVLVKPDMGHLKTWPNVYIPYETYIPVKWDGSDVVDQTRLLLENPKLVAEIRHNAWHVYHNAFPELESRVMGIIESFEK